jgi:hypothetical protein
MQMAQLRKKRILVRCGYRQVSDDLIASVFNVHQTFVLSADGNHLSNRVRIKRLYNQARAKQTKRHEAYTSAACAYYLVSGKETKRKKIGVNVQGPMVFSWSKI